MDMYFVSGAENIKTIFKNEHVALPVGAGVIVFLKNIFALPPSALKIFEADDSGMRTHPTPWSTVNEDYRIYHLTHKMTTQLMSGPGLKPLASRFSANLSSLIRNMDVSLDWQDLPDMYSFIRGPVFRAAVESMCGPNILLINPTFERDFWDFDDHVLHLLKRYPRWLVPHAWKSREKCIQAVANWHHYAKDACQNLDTKEYEPQFGAKHMRARQLCFSRMKGMTAAALATLDLGILWA